ncbi:PREDICTED: uncharacterized protein At4g22160 [Nelumbo nucifera]|uniref:Uncharacterized protein At4g22160 n=2 Tax=Nelumbo nucifera TaxID=4432 RepID=A0A1U7ZFM5_NELNU|nr:PREDICTED: uncharacterized protein At4g22160 [Nelumbo nucifera]DAD23475.1 TPA_asm: hypothetical protein HUJ06_024938 [Nelumbo nucifera]
MAELNNRTDAVEERETQPHDNRLKHAFDAGFLSGSHPPDTPRTVDVHEEEDPIIRAISDSESSDSIGESKWWADLAASVHVFTGSMLRMELAEMEMIKAREAWRVEAERRLIESEAEMTQMLLETQLQVASFLSQKNRKRKRKRVEDEDRRDIWLLGLLCNLNY